MGYTINFKLFVADDNVQLGVIRPGRVPRPIADSRDWRNPTIAELRALVQFSDGASYGICDEDELEDETEAPDAEGWDVKWYELETDILKWSKLIAKPVKAEVKGEDGAAWRVYAAPELDKSISVKPIITWPAEPI